MPTFQDYRLAANLSLPALARRADVDFKTAKRADDGKPVQKLKALALLKVLSQALGQALTIDDIDGLHVL